jgi:PmbA protein
MSDVDIIYMADEALKTAQQAGADEVEVFGLTGKSTHVDIQLDEIDLARESYTNGLGIKAVVRGAVGFSSTNDPDNVRNAAKSAVRYAQVRKNDPHWSGLPHASRYTEVAGIFDPKIAELDVDTCIDLSLQMIEGAVSVKQAKPTSGKFICSSFNYIIMNSMGVEVREKTTKIDGFMECRAGEGTEIATAYEFDLSRNLDIDFFTIGREASRQAAASVEGVGIETGETDVLFKPNAIADILENALLPSLSAENVQKGRSALTGKLGNKIGVDRLNVIDDGLLEGGIGSARSDDEGSPSKTNRIIENGVLATYLYDTYTAGKDGVESTGNAMRNNYSQTTSIDVRNLRLEFPPSDVVDETVWGVLVGAVIGAHTANPISGDFSVEARNSFLIKNGQIMHPIKSMMVAGNVLELLQHISGAGQDVRVLGNIIAPTIKVSGLKVVG